MGTNNKNKKNKTGALLPLIIVALAAIGGLEENFNLNLNGRAIVIVVAAVFVVVLAIFVVYFLKTKLAQKTATEYQFRHSHDRLKTSEVGGECSVDQHWQMQLDGFLKAGIIDRNEYNALLKKHNEQAARSLR